jgi:DNA polymerase II small subunit/DNA polymerase delta subunit B
MNKKQPDKAEGWEKEFDNRFVRKVEDGESWKLGSVQAVKAFIRDAIEEEMVKYQKSLLADYKKDIEEAVKKERERIVEMLNVIVHKDTNGRCLIDIEEATGVIENL